MAQTDLDQFPDSLSTEASSNRRARAQRVKWLLGYVHTHGLKWERKKVVARFATEYAIGPSTVYEYISQLIDGEYLFLLNDHVLCLADYEEMLRESMKIPVPLKVKNPDESSNDPENDIA